MHSLVLSLVYLNAGNFVKKKKKKSLGGRKTHDCWQKILIWVWQMRELFMEVLSQNNTLPRQARVEVVCPSQLRGRAAAGDEDSARVAPQGLRLGSCPWFSTAS